MGVKRFNPAFYVTTTPDGEGKFIPYQALLQWMNATRPGWRVTSDGLKITGMEGMDPDTDEKVVRYTALIHVAVVDEKGRRVTTVPASCSVSTPGFAGDLFAEGARRALEALGFNIYNITTEMWREYYDWKAQQNVSLSAAGSRGGLLSVIAGSIMGSPAPDISQAAPLRDIPPGSLFPPGDVMSRLGPDTTRDMGTHPEGRRDGGLHQETAAGESLADGRPPDGELLREALGLFERLKTTRPDITERMENKFERVCLTLIGGNWDLMETKDHKRLISQMKDLLEG